MEFNRDTPVLYLNEEDIKDKKTPINSILTTNNPIEYFDLVAQRLWPHSSLVVFCYREDGKEQKTILKGMFI